MAEDMLSPRAEELPVVVALCSSRDLDDQGDLEFEANARIRIRKKDGAGWAEGELDDGTVGWFNLAAVETYDPTAEAASSADGDAVVTVEVTEAGEDAAPSPSLSKSHLTRGGIDSDSLLAPDRRKARQDSLVNLLQQRPVREVLVEKSILPNAAVQSAQRKLMKEKKHKKEKEREAQLVERVLHHKSKNKASSNQLVASMDEPLFDELVLTFLNLPRHKYKPGLFGSSSSSEEVVSGSQLMEHMLSNEVFVQKLGLTEPQAKFFAQILVDRNVIIDNAGYKPNFKTKTQYAIQYLQTEYSIINVDKIWEGAVRSAYDVSVELMRDMIDIMQRYMPDFDALRDSRELRHFGLRLAELQKVSFHDMSKDQKKIVNINLYNMMVLYTHAKFNPPQTMVDRKFAYENIQLLANNLVYSLQSLEMRAVKEGRGKDPLIYFCLSDCNKSSPASHVFTVENFEETQKLAARRFLAETVRVDEHNYEVTLPRMMQKIWKDMKIEKADLVKIVHPLLSGDVRTQLGKMLQVGDVSVRFSSSNFTPSYRFEL